MSLAGAVRIGAKRSGADLRRVDVHWIADLAERSIAAIVLVSGLPESDIRDIVRASLRGGRHPQRLEEDRDWYEWFVSFVGNVTAFEATGQKPRRGYLRLVQGGAP